MCWTFRVFLHTHKETLMFQEPPGTAVPGLKSTLPPGWDFPCVPSAIAHPTSPPPPWGLVWSPYHSLDDSVWNLSCFFTSCKCSGVRGGHALKVPLTTHGNTNQTTTRTFFFIYNFYAKWLVCQYMVFLRWVTESISCPVYQKMTQFFLSNCNIW